MNLLRVQICETEATCVAAAQYWRDKGWKVIRLNLPVDRCMAEEMSAKLESKPICAHYKAQGRFALLVYRGEDTGVTADCQCPASLA